MTNFSRNIFFRSRMPRNELAKDSKKMRYDAKLTKIDSKKLIRDIQSLFSVSNLKYSPYTTVLESSST